MDPIKTIGHRLDKDQVSRDCVHMAIMPCIAAEDLHRGEEVALIFGTKNEVKSASSNYELPTIGIVDPFLDLPTIHRNSIVRPPRTYGGIRRGEKCWVFLYPGSITGLRHDWTCQEIDNQPVPSSESEKWLREFACKWNFNYDEMISEAQANDGCVVAQGTDLHSEDELGEDAELFWEHMAKLTNREFSESHKRQFGWSCSC